MSVCFSLCYSVRASSVAARFWGLGVFGPMDALTKIDIGARARTRDLGPCGLYSLYLKRCIIVKFQCFDRCVIDYPP